MKKIEYLTLNKYYSDKDDSLDQDWLNEYGKDGWMWLRTIKHTKYTWEYGKQVEAERSPYTHVFYKYVD